MTTPPAGAGPPTARPASFGATLRAALSDLYYHSWRLVPANIVWSITAVLVLLACVASPLGLLLLPIVALPLAGLFRMATRIARGQAVSFWDAAAAWRTGARGSLTLGTGLSIVAVVFSVNALTGILTGTLLGWAFATFAFWGLVGGWLYAWTAWPILTDPARAAWPIRERLRLAALLLLAHPVRLAGLGIGLAVFLVASLIAIVAIVTVSVAVASVVAARFVLPAADRLDARLGIAANRGLPPIDLDED